VQRRVKSEIDHLPLNLRKLREKILNFLFLMK